MKTILKVNQIVKSVSETHKINKDYLYAVNTSDVFNGEFLTPNFLPINKLKGQFKKSFQKDDILFSEIRPANRRFAKVKFDKTDDYIASTKLMVLRKINDNVNLDYFYYWLTSNNTLTILQSRAKNRIGSFPQITFELLSDYNVPVPELKYQLKIAKLLKTIDDKIILNNKINLELDSIIKTMYDYWFLQFDFPNEKGNPYKSSGGKMIWNDELKREIPKDWEIIDFNSENIFKIINVGVDKFDKKIFLATANIDGELFTEGNIVDYDSRESRANMQPKPYSVWFAKMKDSVKHLFIPKNSNWFTDKYILSTGLYGLQCNENSFSYVASYIKDKNFEIQKDLLAHGSTQKAISDEDLKCFKLVVPPAKLLKKYADKVNPIFEMKFLNLKENQELSSLRDFLLPLLMNGQVTFKE